MSNRYKGVIGLIVFSIILALGTGLIVGEDGNILNKSYKPSEKFVKHAKNHVDKRRAKGFKKNDKIDSIQAKASAGKPYDGRGDDVNLVKLAHGEKFKDGIYRGESYGYEDIVVVDVVIKGGKIADIRVVSHRETPGYYERGASVINRIMSRQSTDVDSVTGATYTSKAIMRAVSNALRKAVVSNLGNEAIIAVTDKGNSEKPKLPSSGNDDTDSSIDFIKQIEQWRSEKIAMKYFVSPLMPDEKLEDGTYIGYGYGYRARSENERWKSSVTVKDGKISKIEVLNAPDDEEYVEHAKKFKNKLENGKIGKRDLIHIHTELEKFYSISPKVKHKFEKNLPVLDKDLNVAKVRNNIKKIEPDAVTGATISTVGMSRSVIDALNKSVEARKNSNEKLEVKKITVVEYPKLDYKVGEHLELKGLKIKLIYNKGAEEDVNYEDFRGKSIKIDRENGELLNREGELSITVSKDKANVTFKIDVENSDSNKKYVEKFVGGYDSPIFVRPPEIGETLKDGVYIGHGQGYYYSTPGASLPISYIQETKVQVVVKEGKVTDVQLLHFGDDVGGGGIGYKARGAKFRASAGDLVKKDTAAFIKQHLNFERYIAALYTNDAYPMFPGDTAEKVSSELGKKMKACDATSGATYSSIGYSRAISEALYKAASGNRMINDMWLEDYDWETKIFTDNAAKIAYFGKPHDVRIAERDAMNYHQTHYYPDEMFRTKNLVLSVMYTDGTVEKYDYNQMIDKGFNVEIIDASVGKGKPGYITEGVTSYIFKRNIYGQMLNIYRKDTDKHIKSEFVNSSLYSNVNK